MDAPAHLLSLPLELRCEIYVLLLDECIALPLPPPNQTTPPESSRLEPYSSLLLVNRQLHDEVEYQFHQNYASRFTILSHTGGITSLLRSLYQCNDEIAQNAYFSLRAPSDFRELTHGGSEREEKREQTRTERFIGFQPVCPDGRGYGIVTDTRPKKRGAWPGRKSTWRKDVARPGRDGFFVDDSGEVDGQCDRTRINWSAWPGGLRNYEPASAELTANWWYTAREQHEDLCHGCWILTGRVKDLSFTQPIANDFRERAAEDMSLRAGTHPSFISNQARCVATLVMGKDEEYWEGIYDDRDHSIFVELLIDSEPDDFEPGFTPPNLPKLPWY